MLVFLRELRNFNEDLRAEEGLRWLIGPSNHPTTSYKRDISTYVYNL